MTRMTYIKVNELVVSFQNATQACAVEKILSAHGRCAGEYIVQCIGEEFGHEGL